MFIEKVLAFLGPVPLQFEPVLYVMGFVAFLWLCDGFFYLCRFMVGGGR